MLAAQYSIALPADYDMSIIRRRVADRGASLDALPGLGLKAYLIEDRSRGGAQNQYSPFYLWNDPSAASRFLWGGGGFGGIVRDFGRPRVATWLGVKFASRPRRYEVPAWATLERRVLPPAVDPGATAARLGDEVTAVAREGGVHSAAAAIDPASWDVVLLTLRTEPPDGTAGTTFEVLHLSAPGMADLADRRTRSGNGDGG